MQTRIFAVKSSVPILIRHRCFPIPIFTVSSWSRNPTNILCQSRFVHHGKDHSSDESLAFRALNYENKKSAAKSRFIDTSSDIPVTSINNSTAQQFRKVHKTKGTIETLITYLESAMPFSMRLDQLRVFTIKLRKNNAKNNIDKNSTATAASSSPKIPLVLIRNMIFECKTMEHVATISRSISELGLTPYAKRELGILALQQAFEISQSSPLTNTSKSKDLINILVCARLQGLEAQLLSASHKAFVVAAADTIFSAPAIPDGMKGISNILISLNRLVSESQIQPDLGRKIATSIAHIVQNTEDIANNYTSKDASLTIYGLSNIDKFASSQSLFLTDKDVKQSLLTLSQGVFRNANSTASPFAAQDLANTLLGLSRMCFTEDCFAESNKQEIFGALEQQIVAANEQSFANIIFSLGNIGFHAKDFPDSLRLVLQQELERRLPTITLLSHSQVLCGCVNMQFTNLFVNNNPAFLKELYDELTQRILSMRNTDNNNNNISDNSGGSKERSGVGVHDFKDIEAFVSSIYWVSKMNIEWGQLPANFKEAFLQRLVTVLPVMSAPQMMTLLHSMGKLHVHYPSLLRYNVEEQLTLAWQRLLSPSSSPTNSKNASPEAAQWSARDISRILLSLAGMGVHWPYVSKTIQDLLYQQMALLSLSKGKKDESTVLTGQVISEGIYAMGQMRISWSALPVAVQNYWQQQVDSYTKDVVANNMYSTTNDDHNQSHSRSIAHICWGLGVMHAPLPTLLGTSQRGSSWLESVLSSAAPGKTWKDAEIVQLWHGLSNLDHASWKQLPSELLSSLLHFAQTHVNTASNAALTVMMLSTVRLAFDFENSKMTTTSGQKENDHRKADLLSQLCRLYLQELLVRHTSNQNNEVVNNNNRQSRFLAPSHWTKQEKEHICVYLTFLRQYIQTMDSSSATNSSATMELISLWQEQEQSLTSVFFPTAVANGAAGFPSSTKEKTLVDWEEDYLQQRDNAPYYQTISPFHQEVSRRLQQLLPTIEGKNSNSKTDNNHMKQHFRKNLRKNQNQHDDLALRIESEYYGLQWHSHNEHGPARKSILPVYPMDITVFYENEPLVFIEIDGAHHYIPQSAPSSTSATSSSSDTLSTESTFQPQLRRMDVLKEHLYRTAYPQVPLIRIPVDGNVEESVVQQKILPVLTQRYQEMKTTASTRKTKEVRQQKYEERKKTSNDEVVATQTPEIPKVDVRKPKLPNEKRVLSLEDEDEADDNRIIASMKRERLQTSVRKSKEKVVMDTIIESNNTKLPSVKPVKKENKALSSTTSSVSKKKEIYYEREEEEEEEEEDAEGDGGEEEYDDSFLDEGIDDDELDDEMLLANMIAEAELEETARKSGIPIEDDNTADLVPDSSESNASYRQRKRREFGVKTKSTRNTKRSSARNSRSRRNSNADGKEEEEEEEEFYKEFDEDDDDEPDDNGDSLPPHKRKFRLNI